ncbi:MAG: hypothetical protein VB858_01750 [Planctomycetaceae bacterium]|jgi:hypothetical protein
MRQFNPGPSGFRMDRQGSMLAHTVIVMTCLSVLLTLSGTLLFRMFRQQSEMTRSIVQTGTLSRLARDFRTDVHRAESITLVRDNGASLQLGVRGATVTWFTVGEVVHRVTGDTPVPDIQTAPRETYRCPYADVRLSIVRTEGQRPLATLQVSRGSQTPPVGFRVHTLSTVVAVGLDNRFAEGGTP